MNNHTGEVPSTADGASGPGRPTPAPSAAARPEPLDPPMLPFALVGTAIWAALAGMAVVFREPLARAGHGSWVWVCVAGVLWGLAGMVVMARHDTLRAARRRAGAASGSENGSRPPVPYPGNEGP